MGGTNSFAFATSSTMGTMSTSSPARESSMYSRRDSQSPCDLCVKNLEGGAVDPESVTAREGLFSANSMWADAHFRRSRVRIPEDRFGKTQDLVRYLSVRLRPKAPLRMVRLRTGSRIGNFVEHSFDTLRKI